MSKDEFLSVGGQAIIEGVMMRSPKYFAVACRAPNGELVVKAEPLEKTWIGRQKWLKTPFLRGSWALLDAMTLGTRAMRFASDVQLASEYHPIPQPKVKSEAHERDVVQQLATQNGIGFADLDKIEIEQKVLQISSREERAELGVVPVRDDGESLFVAFPSIPDEAKVAQVSEKLGKPVVAVLATKSGVEQFNAEPPEATETTKELPAKIQDGVITGAIVFSLLFGIFIFKGLPQLGGSLLTNKFKLSDQQTNLSIEVIKFVFFIGYLAAISQIAQVKEVFKYHGAEHKAINTWEAEKELTLENCRAQTRLHPRCGTSFAIIVLLLGFLVFPFVPRFEAHFTQFKGNIIMMSLGNLMYHVAILPLIAGVAYELLRFAGKFRDSAAVMLLFKPGLWTQLITTKEPDDKQIEVALESLKACLAGEETLKAK